MAKWLVLVAVSCGSSAVQGPPDESTTSNVSEAEASEAESVEVEPDEHAVQVVEAESAEQEAGVTTDQRTSADRPATVFTRISFDLRGMPHRGPYDVDPARINSRVESLMHRAREAAGEPPPRLSNQPGISSFRAEFVGPEPEALAQCERVVAEVAPAPADPTKKRGRSALRAPRAEPCGPIDP